MWEEHIRSWKRSRQTRAFGVCLHLASQSVSDDDEGFSPVWSVWGIITANLTQGILTYARGVSKRAAGTGWDGLAGGGFLPILRWNGQETEETEDERSGDLFLPARERGGRWMPTSIPTRELTNLAL